MKPIPQLRFPCRQELPVDAAAAKADGAEVGMYVLARIAGENADRRDEPGDYYITEEERAQIATLCEAYEKVILVVNTGGLDRPCFYG